MEAMWERLFPPDQPNAFEKLPPEDRDAARAAADAVLTAHRDYMADFSSLTSRAREVFENRAWLQGAVNAEQRGRLYRSAVEGAWRAVSRAAGDRILVREFWMGARRVFLERAFSDYDADLALTFFYSVMRLALDKKNLPVEYHDDGLAGRPGAGSHLWRAYPAGPAEIARSIEAALHTAGFSRAFEDASRDANLAAARILQAWRESADANPVLMQILVPVFFRDEEAYLVGRLKSDSAELPVVLALRNEPAGITLDAVLTGREDMRNILFVSTRSTFNVDTAGYRELLEFLDSLAPERGMPAMCAVIGFTHPARVELHQLLRTRLESAGECFEPAPGRAGTAMVVFAPPGFPYVYKVVRDYSVKQGWMGSERIMSLYRWVHEINRGRLMLDAWIYRNLHFTRSAFSAPLLEELLSAAPRSVRLDGDTVILKSVYAQRRVRPLNLVFDEERDPARREQAADALGCFIKDLGAMGLFTGDHYGLTSNVGLTHANNAVLFDFDDLGPLLQFNFREAPQLSGKDELLWNPEIDGPWFKVDEDDVLVDEWERWLGVPEDLRPFFRERHGDLFTTQYWASAQARLRTGELRHIVPYPQEKKLREPAPRHPWLSVPLEDYEAHMRSGRVRQLGALSELFARALELCRPRSVAVLGVAGGNGLERLERAGTGRIVGIDINPEYLAQTRARFGNLNGLELHCLDLSCDTVSLQPVDLVHAALIFEHAGIDRCLENALSMVAPGGSLSAVLQLPSESEADVGASGLLSIRAIESRFSLVPPECFRAIVEQRGFKLEHEERRPLVSGKAFWMAIFRRFERAAL